jgi:hypothetical protein
VIREVGHTIQCNNFSELETTDDGRVRPNHVGKGKGKIISCTVDVNTSILHEINKIFIPQLIHVTPTNMAIDTADSSRT